MPGASCLRRVEGAARAAQSHHDFNDAISIVLLCDDQAMLEMVKLNIAQLERAYRQPS